MSRTKNSIINSITAVSASATNIAANFIAQKIFVNILGVEYLGINGVFANVLSLLNIAELGLGEAIIFHLYKPIADNNNKKIQSLMLFYKKAYIAISILIAIAGLILLPFIRNITGSINSQLNIEFIYILFLGQIISSYQIAYKRSILYAKQKSSIINLVHISYIVILNTIQVIILAATRNYYAYLSIKIIANICENLILSIYAQSKYPDAFNKNANKIDTRTKKDISKRVKAMGLHKVGGFIVNGTDNLLISNMFNIASVGLYSNYHLIINAISQLFTQIISSATASIGNLLTENNEKKNYEVYRRLFFLNYYISVITSVCILVAIQPAIEIWMGKQFLFIFPIVIVLVINYYQKTMRKTFDTFMVAAGVCVENRFIPLIESILNIIFSIVLAKTFGLIGIFIGTTISSFALWFYSYPLFMYKKIIKRKTVEYYKDIVCSFALFAIIAAITYMAILPIKIDSIIPLIIARILTALIVTNIALYALFCRTQEFKYYKNILIKTLQKLGKNK